VGVCGGVFGFDEVGAVFEIVSDDAIASDDVFERCKLSTKLKPHDYLILLLHCFRCCPSGRVQLERQQDVWESPSNIYKGNA
jgi:hypothetical protein